MPFRSERGGWSTDDAEVRETGKTVLCSWEQLLFKLVFFFFFNEASLWILETLWSHTLTGFTSACGMYAQVMRFLWYITCFSAGPRNLGLSSDSLSYRSPHVWTAPLDRTQDNSTLSFFSFWSMGTTLASFALYNKPNPNRTTFSFSPQYELLKHFQHPILFKWANILLQCKNNTQKIRPI